MYCGAVNTRMTVALVLAAILVPLSSLSATSWYIKADGSGDVPTIQAGIDSSATGDTVIVAISKVSGHDAAEGGESGA
jgi:hypothetical protein